VPSDLAPEHVEPLLRGRFGRPYAFVESCASTQRLLPAEPEGAVVAAERQTEGRGRLGRRWLAPEGTSVLFSVRLAPAVPTERLPELSLVAGDAVAAAIEQLTGLAPTIKFPNDVLVDGRKVCGILAEASEGRVALGIGINANQDEGELPAGAETPAGSLRLASGAKVDRAHLLALVLCELERRYDAWVSASRR
jgi:BirA family biotin operon repressor/biotin-[acetyl-CoA-carboxylase] ligase